MGEAISPRVHPAVLARAALGLGLLIRPRPIVETLAGGSVGDAWVAAGRVLGARHIAEVVAVNVRPAAGAFWVGAGVDAIHAATAAGAAASGHQPRLSSANAAIATCFALAGARHARALGTAE